MKAMKKIFTALLAVAMTLALVSAAAAIELEGAGTSESPYQIGSAEELLEFAKRVTDGGEGLGLYAELTGDITVDEWTVTATNSTTYNSIGAGSSSPYVGEFDGNDFTLTLTKTATTGSVALFNTIGASGVVRNLNLHVTFSGISYIAGVAAENYGKIEDVTVSGTITATDRDSYTGGIAGLSGCTFDEESNVVPGKILRCLNKAAVTGKQYVGGIAGSFLGEMSHCGNVGTITGTQYVGGLLTMGAPRSPVQKRFIVSDCYNAGQVVGTSNFAGLLGVVGTTPSMSKWRDSETDEYPDFQVSNVFSYGGISDLTKGVIIAGLTTSANATNFLPADITKIFSNTYYRESIGGKLFTPTNLNSGDGLETVKTVIHSQTDAEFASEAMAERLNGDRSEDDAPWEYIEDARYPTLKVLDDSGAVPGMVSVGSQSGTIRAGTAGEVTFTVTTANIDNGSQITLNGGDSYGISLSSETASTTGTSTLITIKTTTAAYEPPPEDTPGTGSF